MIFEAQNCLCVNLHGFRVRSGQADVQLTGRSARPSSGSGGRKGQIVGRSNGEGRGVACRAIKPNGKT
jgi:hypothetical protein